MEFLALTIIFWLPVYLIILKNAFWDLYFIEQKEYRFSRLFTHFYWDHEEVNRRPWVTNLKFILFAVLTSMFISTTPSLIAILFAYVIWIDELFKLIENIFIKKIKNISLTPRNLVILGLLIVTFLIVAVTVSLPFIMLDRSNISISLPVRSITGNTSGQYIVFLDFYIFLGLSTLIALFLDLASPILIAIFAYLTSPIGWITNQVAVLRLKKKLALHRRNLTIIAITGSEGKSTTKNYLIQLLSHKYRVKATSDVYSSIPRLSDDIVKVLKDSTQVLLVELEGYQTGELKRICEILDPDISIITNIDTHHIGLFKNIRGYVNSRMEVVDTMNKNGLLIGNIDNKYVAAALNKFHGEKSAYSLKHKHLKQSVNEYSIDKILRNKAGQLAFRFSKDNSSYDFKTIIYNKSDLEQLIPAVICAEKLGLSITGIKDQVAKLKDSGHTVFTMKGDNESRLIINANIDSNYNGILSALDLAKQYKKRGDYKKIILISDGIKELGKFKKKIYQKLVSELAADVGIVITTDSTLHNTIVTSKAMLLSTKVSNVNDLIYETRKFLGKKDLIILEGAFSNEIIESLRAEDL